MLGQTNHSTPHPKLSVLRGLYGTGAVTIANLSQRTKQIFDEAGSWINNTMKQGLRDGTQPLSGTL
jgi:hypothetical protein